MSETPKPSVRAVNGRVEVTDERGRRHSFPVEHNLQFYEWPDSSKVHISTGSDDSCHNYEHLPYDDFAAAVDEARRQAADIATGPLRNTMIQIHQHRM
jgi:hypothetical protein